MATVETEGARLYYEVHGDGPAVVFAHGRGGNAASWWQQVPAFAARCKVVVFDHRGFGRSRCDAAQFDCGHFHRDILAILDAEGIERASLVCQSMGGWGGLKLAATHPERVAALVLSNTPGGVDAPAVTAAIEHLASGAIPPGSAQLGASFNLANPEAAYLCAQISGLNSNFPKPFGRITRAGFVTAEDLRGYAVPTLMVTAPEDLLFPPAVIAEAAAAIPGAQLVELPGAGHSPYFETPVAFNALVLEFLEATSESLSPLWEREGPASAGG